MNAQTNVTTTEAIKQGRKQDVQHIDAQVGLTSTGSFALTMRIATMLANSTMVPEQYRIVMSNKKAAKLADGTYPLIENPNGLSNCVIALNMANRMGADPLMIMQNLFTIEGRPSWSSQFIIAAVNNCGRYSPLRFDIVDKGEIDAEYTTRKWDKAKNGYQETQHKIKIQNLICTAWAIEKATGERLESSPISMELAVKEGWYQKSGSKWQTMPEQMLRYRSASFFGRIYAPELLMGLSSADEVQDMIDVTPNEVAASKNLSDFDKSSSQVIDEVKPTDAKEVTPPDAQYLPATEIAAICKASKSAKTMHELDMIFDAKVTPYANKIKDSDLDLLNSIYDEVEASFKPKTTANVVNSAPNDVSDPFGNME